MFGHDDNDNNQKSAEPQADGTLTSPDQHLTALPPADMGAPSLPKPADSTDTTDAGSVDTPTSATPGFIATDDKGQPDATHGTALDGPSGDLLDIKQQALQQLSPLVGHLNQSPEEKFRTTMMMIQASDDQSLIPVAYTAAKEITDEKTRAQALLDIVNEINYFTQHHDA
jgi:hypothetical protein